MHAAVRFLYRAGVKQAHPTPPVVGQLMTQTDRGVPVLKLWPLDWVHNAGEAGEALATLWRPELCAVLYDSIVVRGLEAGAGARRCWTAQRWLCELLSAERARAPDQPDPRFGVIEPTR